MTRGPGWPGCGWRAQLSEAPDPAGLGVWKAPWGKWCLEAKDKRGLTWKQLGVGWRESHEGGGGEAEQGPSTVRPAWRHSQSQVLGSRPQEEQDRACLPLSVSAYHRGQCLLLEIPTEKQRDSSKSAVGSPPCSNTPAMPASPSLAQLL